MNRSDAPKNSPCPIHSRTLRMGGKPRTQTRKRPNPQSLWVPHPFAHFANGWETTNPNPQSLWVPHPFAHFANGWETSIPNPQSPKPAITLGAPSIRALCEWVGNLEPKPASAQTRNHSGCPIHSRTLRMGGKPRSQTVFVHRAAKRAREFINAASRAIPRSPFSAVPLPAVQRATIPW
jgi:hypothetical protein